MHYSFAMIQPSWQFCRHDFLKTSQNQSAGPMSSWTLNDHLRTAILFCSLYQLLFCELQEELSLKSFKLEFGLLCYIHLKIIKPVLLLPCNKQLDFHMLQSFISTGFCASIFSAPLPVRGYKTKILHHRLVTQTDKHIQGISAQPKPTT